MPCFGGDARIGLCSRCGSASSWPRSGRGQCGLPRALGRVRAPPLALQGQIAESERRDGAAADLAEEEIEIRLEPIEKHTQVAVALHIGKIPRLPRRAVIGERSEERRVGKESVSKCRYRWASSP